MPIDPTAAPLWTNHRNCTFVSGLSTRAPGRGAAAGHRQPVRPGRNPSGLKQCLEVRRGECGCQPGQSPEPWSPRADSVVVDALVRSTCPAGGLRRVGWRRELDRPAGVGTTGRDENAPFPSTGLRAGETPGCARLPFVALRAGSGRTETKDPPTARHNAPGTDATPRTPTPAPRVPTPRAPTPAPRVPTPRAPAPTAQGVAPGWYVAPLRGARLAR
jgi:hypothetical protein